MRISTKGRYALRVMIDLARNGKDEYVKLHELSARQQISEKYLEGILGTLVRGKLLEGARGKGGGYRLKVKPEKCSVWRIISLMENSYLLRSIISGDHQLSQVLRHPPRVEGARHHDPRLPGRRKARPVHAQHARIRRQNPGRRQLELRTIEKFYNTPFPLLEFFLYLFLSIW